VRKARACGADERIFRPLSGYGRVPTAELPPRRKMFFAAVKLRHLNASWASRRNARCFGLGWMVILKGCLLGPGMHSPAATMKSYDEIKTILEAELEEAKANHDREALDRHRTGITLARVLDHYNRFTLHGVVPEHLSDEDII
jgi:hypothetical protein